MSLGPGQRLGPYEVLSPLGAGGMGVVWRSRDTRLGREVALKVLPDELAGSAERRARLEHEARLLASLNHPRIAALYDVLDFEGSPVLVMEVVEGETLAERLSRGPIPLKTALELALQIAEALEAAHERGILHRDLKPSNVKLASEGGVKVLDFGLAKALESEESSDEGIPSSLATLPKRVEKTDTGVAIGTAPYMSPEQARGEPVNRRTDVWAFGCILFEMLSGRRVFPGATRSDALAAVLEHEPDWSSLPKETPDGLQRFLKRCLRKEKKSRIRDIADVKLELEDLLSEITIPRAALQNRRRKVGASALAALAALVGLAAVAVWLLQPKKPSGEVRLPRFQLSLPRGVRVLEVGSVATALAISPDGRKVSFVGCADNLGCQLYLRDSAEIDARPLPGTEDAGSPFFSPDGRWIGFGAQGKLKKIDLNNGAVVTLADAPQFRGGSWGEDGTIVFSRSTDRGVLLAVPAEGGETREVTRRDDQERAHRWPRLLPRGRAVLFNFYTGGGGVGSRPWSVGAFDLASGTRKVLVESAGNPRYIAGHLLFGRDGIVYAAPLDVETLELTRAPAPVLEDVFMWSSPGENNSAGANVYYDVASDGALVFSPREARLPKRTLVLVDREGRREPVSRSQRAYTRPLFSRDGRRIAVSVEMDVGSWGAFVVDIASDAWTRVGGDVTPAAWMPDSERLLLIEGVEALLLAPIDGSEPAATLHVGESDFVRVTPDGSAVLFGSQAAPSLYDIWRLTLANKSDAQPWLATGSSEGSPDFSADGRWVVYSSNDSGRDEIYVRPYAGSGGRHQVSTQGGSWPRWSRDGREIFFVSQGSLWSAAVRTSTTFEADSPRKLFDLSDELLTDVDFYDASPDGRHFAMIQKDPFELRPLDIVVVPGWAEEMKARLAAAK